MGKTTEINWATATFNPWIGCTKVSEGCKHCYAERDFDKRRHVVEWGPGKPRKRTTEAYWRQPLTWNRKAAKDEERPRVFCASLADWLDPEVPIEWLVDLLDLVSQTKHLDWLLLTKRPELWRHRMEDALNFARENEHACSRMLHLWVNGIPPYNVWIGATVENQKNTARIPHLLQIPVMVRFLSCEPLLGPVDIASGAGVTYWDDPVAGIHWVITGGESGPNARPMHPEWVRDIRDQCQENGIAYLHKQWGEWAPGECAQDAPTKTERTAKWWDDKWIFEEVSVKSSEEMHCDYEPDLYRLGKARAGRTLDGVIHNEFPKVGR